MIDLPALRHELIRYEGFSTKVYLDTLGNKTVGIGHCDNKMVVGTEYHKDIIEGLYINDVKNALAVCMKIEHFAEVDDFRQRLLVNLAFNMGNKLLQFKKMIRALLAHDFRGASIELENSRWHDQVGVRGIEMVFAMENGHYHWDLEC